MSEPRTFDVNAFLDGRKVGRTHLLVVALLILTMMVDGYDIFLVGIVLPALAADFDVTPAALTIVFVTQQFGLLLGNFVVGPIADRVGRRVTLLWCLAIFGVLTLAAAGAQSVAQLVVLRFVAGVFFSGVIPNAIALVSEIMPARLRATSVSITFAGYTGGATLIGAPVLAWVLPYGWRLAFVVGGALPLALAAVLALTLPESLRFLAGRDSRDPRIPRLLRRLEPTLSFDGSERFAVRGLSTEGAPTTQGSTAQGPTTPGPTTPGPATPGPAAREATAPILALFRERRWVTTLLLWVGFHMAFVVSNLFGAWKITVLGSIGGLPDTRIAMLMAVQGTAGVFGTLTSGFVMDRLGPTRVLGAYLAAAALATAVVAFIDLGSGWMIPAFLAFGYFANGGLSGINALASISYPSKIRATGISWAHSAGRAGAMIGPLLGGAMIARGMGVSAVFLVTAIPQALAAAAIFALWRADRGAESSLPSAVRPASA